MNDALHAALERLSRVPGVDAALVADLETGLPVAAELAHGASGVQPALCRLLEAMLDRGVLPVVPAQGSVGASGDLAPLAHLALVLIGVLPLGVARVTVEDEFEEAGINQTRHRLYMHVEGEMRVVMPLMPSRVKVAVQVPIAEGIIVGDVPFSYLNVRLGK